MAIGRTNAGVGGGGSYIPQFTYTGSFTLLDDGNKNWRLKLLTSGTLTFSKLGKGNGSIDVFLVGGGAGGAYNHAQSSPYTGHGGGGGYTFTQSGVVIQAGTAYQAVIGNGGNGASTGGSTDKSGSDGGNTTFMSFTAIGGKANGDGGSGGAPENKSSGASAGSDGGDGVDSGGTAYTHGQGTTTREFGEVGGTLYAGGGGSGRISGGNGGGGGGDMSAEFGYDGATNYGGGGSGTHLNGHAAGKGGSGIVVIRNMR